MQNTYQEDVCAPLWLVGWEGKGGPVGGGLVLFEFKSWSVLQDMVPDVEELIFAQVSV